MARQEATGDPHACPSRVAAPPKGVRQLRQAARRQTASHVAAADRPIHPHVRSAAPAHTSHITPLGGTDIVRPTHTVSDHAALC
jgi:hypothetical protein